MCEHGSPKGGEFASNRLEDQEVQMLCLHLLQVSLVYVNTLSTRQKIKTMKRSVL